MEMDYLDKVLGLFLNSKQWIPRRQYAEKRGGQFSQNDPENQEKHANKIIINKLDMI